MADSVDRRRRNEHLKKLRQKQKNSRKAEKLPPRPRKKSAARKGGGGGWLLILGLLICAGVLVVLLGSMALQYRERSKAVEAAAPDSTATAPAVDPGAVEVRVLNGCGAAGAGRLMTNRLRDHRFDVVIAENAQHFGYEYTVVINHTPRPEVGRAVAAAIGCERVSFEEDHQALVDATVILGQDWEELLGDTLAPGPAATALPDSIELKALFGRVADGAKGLLDRK